MEKESNYSVLMSVYYKEKPEFLRESVLSIINQTAPTNDFVLVCDGELTRDLNEVIDEIQHSAKDIFNVIRLPKNVGLGRALNEGIKHCKNELVARMDSDDISYPDRCEKQLEVFKKINADIVSGAVEEFNDSPSDTYAKRILPETHENIVEFAKKRNPFNHPCVMYRKSAVQNAGGYQDFYLLEDYYLWIRMLINGSTGYNLQEPILWMRAGNGMYKRRSGLKYAKSQIALLKFMKEKKFIDELQYLKSAVIRVGLSAAPNFLRKFIYNIFLRK